MANPAAAIVLDVITYTDGVAALVALWLAAPANRVKPIAPVTSATTFATLSASGASGKSPNSAVPVITPFNLTNAELNAIENGYLVEVVWNTGKYANTAALNAAIIAEFTTLQTALTASAFSTNLVGGRYDNTGAFTAPAAVTIPALPT
jgi:hypothetical protein